MPILLKPQAQAAFSAAAFPAVQKKYSNFFRSTLPKSRFRPV
jgi:hypothetical protein